MTETKKAPRELLIEASIKLFNERGFYGVSIADIAGSLGISKATIYHHIETKMGLAMECFGRCVCTDKSIKENRLTLLFAMEGIAKSEEQDSFFKKIFKIWSKNLAKGLY